MGRLAAIGQRTGYGFFVAAIGVFAYGAATSFTAVVAVLVVIALALGSVTLAPAIVLGYAVKAADREERLRSAPVAPSAGSAGGEPD
jgi:hypothetical protein